MQRLSYELKPLPPPPLVLPASLVQSNGCILEVVGPADAELTGFA